MEHKHIKCPKCGNDTQADFPYCNYCGSKLINIELQEKKIAEEPSTGEPNIESLSIPYANNTSIPACKGDTFAEKSIKRKFLSVGFIVMMIIGIVLFIYGCTIKIPSEKLSYYGYNGTSKIEEYVGGDAYNYIIGAEIVGSKIVATKTERAIFICIGLFMATLGGAIVAYEERRQIKDKQKKVDEI